MKREPPTPIELVAAPELAVLHALEELVELSHRVLVAAHPELEQADFFPDAPQLDIDTWLADALLAHLTGVETAVGRYRAHLRTRDALRTVESPDGF